MNHFLKRRSNIILNIILMLLLLLTIYPFFFTLMTSFKDNGQFYKQFWALPNPFVMSNYESAIAKILPYIGNSLIISVASITGVLTFASMAAYAFARLRFPLKDFLFASVLALLMIPSLLQLIPRFLILRDLHLLDSYFGIVLGYLAGQMSFSIFIIRSFFDSQPEELFEAARLDGCKEYQAFYKIAIPLIKPVLGTVAIVVLLAVWNDYLWPLVVTTDPSMFTIAVGLMQFKAVFQDTTVEWGPVFAGYVVSAAPLVILFFFMMNSFIEGLTAGAIKM
ncbi:MAG: carbohydrate ABC transporter permease [Clostridia bacterium]